MNFKRHINLHLLTYIATAVSLYIFFFVDQIQRIWYQSPPRSAGAIVIIGYSLFMAITIGYCVVAMIELVYKTSRVPVVRSLYSIPGVKRIWKCCRFLTFDWLLMLVRRNQDLRAVIGVASLIVGIGLLFFGPKPDYSLSSWYPLFGTFSHSVGLILILLGIWCLFKRLQLGQQTFLGVRVFHGLLNVQSIRVLAWMIQTLVVTEILWLLASNAHLTGDLLTYRLYTIWTCFIYFSMLIIIASVVDHWAIMSTWPVRMFAILLLVYFVWTDGSAVVTPNDYQRHQSVVREVSEANQSTRLIGFFNQKVASINDPDGPIIIVAASGGGSRAAIFTSLVLETLQRTGVDGQFHSGSEPTGKRTLADNILMISSVSGGSLATAHFVQQRPDWPLPINDLHHSTKRELINRILVQIRNELAVYIENLRRSNVEGKGPILAPMEPFWKLVNRDGLLIDPAKYPDVDSKLGDIFKSCRINLELQNPRNELRTAHHRQIACWIDNFLNYQSQLESEDILKNDTWTSRWLLQSPNFDDMCTDFMAPIMRGLMSPRMDRGDALGRFWTERFRWQDSSNIEGYAKPGQAPKYEIHHPACLYNATDVRDGKRLVATFPPNSANFWKPVYEKNPPVRLTTMSEFDANRCISLSRAVRMSSNFPFGFRVLEYQKPNFDPNQPPIKLEVLDGGVVDNTGLDTLYEAFRGFEFYENRYLNLLKSTTDPSIKAEPLTDEQQNASKQVIAFLNGLRDRKVILLEIDAGAKPQQESNGLFDAVSIPMNAINNSAYLNSELNKQFYINEIRRILCRSPGDPNNCPTILHYRFECNHYDPLTTTQKNDVMTAWTLGPQDKANVIGRFLLELDRWTKEIKIMNESLSTSDAILKETKELWANQRKLLGDSNSLVNNLASRLVNFDQKTEAEARQFAGEYEQIQKRFDTHAIKIDDLIKKNRGSIYAKSAMVDEVNQLKLNLAYSKNLIEAKNKAIQLAAAKNVNVDRAKILKMSFDPQSTLNKSAVESQQNLGKAKPPAPVEKK